MVQSLQSLSLLASTDTTVELRKGQNQWFRKSEKWLQNTEWAKTRLADFRFGWMLKNQSDNHLKLIQNENYSKGADTEWWIIQMIMARNSAWFTVIRFISLHYQLLTWPISLYVSARIRFIGLLFMDLRFYSLYKGQTNCK
jgi:hypothetical protein